MLFKTFNPSLIFCPVRMDTWDPLINFVSAGLRDPPSPFFNHGFVIVFFSPTALPVELQIMAQSLCCVILILKTTVGDKYREKMASIET